MLSVAFKIFGSPEHRLGPALIDELLELLPSGIAAVLTLDLANTLCRQRRLEEHPFDTVAGHRLLEASLTREDAVLAKYTVNCVACLPFLKDETARNRLAALAMDDSDPHVQMEAAWATAYLGSEAGVKCLARMTTDVHSSIRAQRYLEELCRTDAIPEACREPNFLALAKMSQWLAHPNECGRHPDNIELYDTRELYWPPTDDVRRLWIDRYKYDSKGPEEPAQTGLGLVGSVTFALFSDVTADLFVTELSSGPR
jgi:hypothetical protein